MSGTKAKKSEHEGEEELIFTIRQPSGFSILRRWAWVILLALAAIAVVAGLAGLFT